MNNKHKEFLKELADLLDKYDASIYSYLADYDQDALEIEVGEEDIIDDLGVSCVDVNYLRSLYEQP